MADPGLLFLIPNKTIFIKHIAANEMVLYYPKRLNVVYW